MRHHHNINKHTQPATHRESKKRKKGAEYAKLMNPCPPSICENKNNNRHQKKSHHLTLAGLRGLARTLGFFNLADQQLKCFGNVLVVPSRGFGPPALELFGEGLSVLGRDLSLFGSQIALIAHDADGNVVGALFVTLLAFVHQAGREREDGTQGYTDKVVQNLVPDDLDHLKGRHRLDRVHQHVAMDADKVLRVQDAVLILLFPSEQIY